ncbi:restriction endonuclease subunit S [Acinetobacter sp. 230853]|uniref:restriction endonuclease subunit S n=1 Tax=Acinetobacter sp. 230853 TaxID=1310651 RepID=UPI000450F79D|nr:restriction endonuclease subunit S [Acinetobacter sp. 230853]EXB72673.1 type I restriction modification DNA specificity domain protein [Acinetobacter sp. 230853]
MFKKYDAYKDSGVQWIGDIPSHWVRKKIKSIANIYSGDSLSPDMKAKFSISTDCSNPYISSKDIDVDTSQLNYETGLSIPSYFSKYKLAPKNSVLLCIEGGSAGRKIALTEIEVNFVNKLACFYSMKISNKFIFYYLKSQPFQVQFKLALSGLIGGVSLSSLENFEIYQPLKTEQDQIVAFLDKKIIELDQAIAIKEQQIALLNERKQIVIQKAVTQGLNPNVAMKDSGVEWIGEIPEHWEVRANRTIFKERNEQGKEGLPLLSVSIHSGVSNEEISEEENVRGRIKIEDKSKYILVKQGDIAFNMMRAWQGGIGAVSVDGMVSPAYIVAKPNKLMNSEFFEYQYRCPEFIQQMDRYSKGITDFRKRLYWDGFKQLMTIVPPIDEQQEIIYYIKKLDEQIAFAIDVKKQQIEKLKEYKTTLINDAVTGKIKVA